MAKVLLLSDGSCQGLPVPAHVKVVAVEGLTIACLLTLLDHKPDLVPPGRYDVIILHVGANNIRHSYTVQTYVSLLDLLKMKILTLSPSAKVVVSSILPWPNCSNEALELIKLTNKALSHHFGQRGFVNSNFKLLRGGKPRPDLFEAKGHQLNETGKLCLSAALASFLLYLIKIKSDR